MKKLLVTLAVLFGSTVLVGRADIAQAVNLGTALVANGVGNTLSTLSTTTLNGEVGDIFTAQNVSGESIQFGSGPGDTGEVSHQGGLPRCDFTGGNCRLTNNSLYTFRIVRLGTITVLGGTSGTRLTLTIGSGGGGGATGPAPVVKGSFDPNGGECVFDGQKKTSQHDFFAIGYVYAPGEAECSRPGYVFSDWLVKGSSPSTSAGLPVLVHEPDEFTKVKRHFVAKAGDYVAKWSPAVTFNMAGGTCTILGESRSGTYSVAVDSQGQTTPGTFLRVPAPEACSRVGYEFAGWIGDGARANSGEILFASSIVTAKWQPTMIIVGERTTVSGKPGICVSGRTTGIAAGDTVVAYVRFPGGDYAQGSARPVVGADGSFEWCRKTGKKSYVFFTNSDGSVTSNRIIISPA